MQDYGLDMLDPARRAHYRRMLGDLVIEYLKARNPHPTAGERAGTDPSSLQVSPGQPRRR